jgi:hypothetical protein
MQSNPLTEAIRLVGLGRLASGLGRSGQAVRKWEAAGRLPRTEWTGETNYAEQIEKLTGGAVPKSELLAKWPAAQQEAA